MNSLDEGSHVQIAGSNKIGRIISILKQKKKATVIFDKCEISIPLNILKSVNTHSPSSNRKKNLNSTVNLHIHKPHYSTPFQTEIDLHGFFVQEAIEYLEIYIDKALLTKQKSLTIIHGKGSGTLRNAVREYLKKHKYVKIVKFNINTCNDGITYIDLI